MSRRREPFLPPVVLDRASNVPLHRQISRQIAEAQRSSVLPVQARLPSTRQMARILRVSRNTVLAAYEDLAAGGLIEGKRGSGTRLNGTIRELALYGLHGVIQASGYPARVLAITDQDGNPLYIRL